MNAAGGSSEIFSRLVAQAFSNAGFAIPAAGDVAVVVFDGTAWLGYAAAAEYWLDAGERQRAARFRYAHDRLAYVLAHAMWRSTLGYCLGCGAAAVPLASTPAGQPQLPDTPWATSLSHSGNWVAMAVGHAAVLGVDIERSPPLRALSHLMSTICTPQEAADMQHLAPALREPALLRLWTRKEALLKAFGTGLSGISPATLSVPPDLCLRPPKGLDRPSCRVRDLQLPAMVVGALAVPDTMTGGCHVHLLGRPEDAPHF